MAEFKEGAEVNESSEEKERFPIGLQELKKPFHTFYFCYNLIHILKVALEYYRNDEQLTEAEAMDKA